MLIHQNNIKILKINFKKIKLISFWQHRQTLPKKATTLLSTPVSSSATSLQSAFGLINLCNVFC